LAGVGGNLPAGVIELADGDLWHRPRFYQNPDINTRA
jgi:hypothetical protein